jgi:hypothetical protein
VDVLAKDGLNRRDPKHLFLSRWTNALHYQQTMMSRTVEVGGEKMLLDWLEEVAQSGGPIRAAVAEWQ